MDRRSFSSMLAMGTAPFVLPNLNPANAQSIKTNFVVIFADDLGYGDLSSFGHPVIRTPNLDRMANDGIKLTSFYAAAPFCTPSRAALLTGRYPIRCGQPNNLGPDSKKGLPLSEITIADELKKEGYRTMCIGKWHLGHNPVEYMPTSRGFDQYYGLLYSNDMIRPWVGTDSPMHLFRDLNPVENHPVDQDTLTERYTHEAVKFIKESKDKPFFLYMPHSMPHLPARTSDNFRGKSGGGLYGDVIEMIDWSVGQILRTLEEEDLDENTMVIFTSDNGPWLNLPDRMLQGGNERWHSGFKGLLRGAKGNTYEGGMRVPFIARFPNRIPTGRVSYEMATTLDLFPTILNEAKRDLPDKTYDGYDILPFMQGNSNSPRDEFYYCRSTNLEGIREGSWKLRVTAHVRDGVEGGKPIPPELFHLNWDPAEQYNMAARNPDKVKALFQKMQNKAKEIGADISEMV